MRSLQANSETPEVEIKEEGTEEILPGSKLIHIKA